MKTRTGTITTTHLHRVRRSGPFLIIVAASRHRGAARTASGGWGGLGEPVQARRAPTHDRARPRRLGRRFVVERRHRAPAAAGLHRRRPAEPASRPDERRGSTWPASCRRSPDRSCSSPTPTGGSSPPTPPRATPTSGPWSTSTPSSPTRPDAAGSRGRLLRRPGHRPSTSCPAPEASIDIYLRSEAEPALPGLRGMLRQRRRAATGGRAPRRRSGPQRSNQFFEPSGASGVGDDPRVVADRHSDHVIPPAQQQAMSTNAGAQISEVDAGHLSLITRPGTVVRFIRTPSRRSTMDDISVEPDVRENREIGRYEVIESDTTSTLDDRPEPRRLVLTNLHVPQSIDESGHRVEESSSGRDRPCSGRGHDPRRVPLRTPMAQGQPRGLGGWSAIDWSTGAEQQRLPTAPPQGSWTVLP